MTEASKGTVLIMCIHTLTKINWKNVNNTRNNVQLLKKLKTHVRGHQENSCKLHPGWMRWEKDAYRGLAAMLRVVRL